MSQSPIKQLPSTTDRSYGIIAIRLDPSLSLASSTALTTRTTQVLLILQRTISPLFLSFWCFPKGHAEFCDASTLHSAIREIHEETSLTVTTSDIITFTDKAGEVVQFRERYINPIRRQGKEVRFWVAEIKGEEAEKELRVQEREIEEARWCTFEEASKLLKYQETREVAELVGMCLNGFDGRKRVIEDKGGQGEKL
jgi:bis(5'-nucleosidyl)-tetraphosphatase